MGYVPYVAVTFHLLFAANQPPRIQYPHSQYEVSIYNLPLLKQYYMLCIYSENWSFSKIKVFVKTCVPDNCLTHWDIHHRSK